MTVDLLPDRPAKVMRPGRPPSPVPGVTDTQAGHWRLYARRPGRNGLQITRFRGVPTKVGGWVLSDPFSVESMTLALPKVTMFDHLGHGELDWVGYGTDVDLVWVGDLPAGYPLDSFRVECFMSSFDFSPDGLTVGLSGALLQLDNYLAKPEYPARPLPYEWAIGRQFTGRPDLRLKRLRKEFPADWTLTYAPPPKGTRLYLIPTGVKKGEKWTGLVTRETGSFDPVLSSYTQTLLASMWTDRGRWALDLDPHRQPVLRHRPQKYAPDAATLILDPAAPGVAMSLAVDWSQSLNVVYGQGSSLSGEGYTGQVVTNDGQRTSYEPLAALRQVDPVGDDNGWLDTGVMRKEVSIQLQQGLTLAQARQVGAAHLKQYAEPGVTGEVTLTADVPLGLDGAYLSRFLILAGMSAYLPNLFGMPDGLMVHITKVDVNLDSGTVTLTIDSKYRDALTVDEVKLRGRDALQVARQLIGGQYQPSVPDLLKPWNYTEGSGYVPSGPHFSSRRLFEEMPDEVKFPWTDWTTLRPPRDPSWRKCYMGIGPRNANADNNWGFVAGPGGAKLAFPIKMAQAGQIRMLQIAAYDLDGNIMPVKFHFSLYMANGTSVRSMPRITAADLGSADGFKAGQHYPFFGGAWERYRVNGTQVQTEDPLSVSSAGLVRAWGTRNVPAGYWPGSALAGDQPTGMLVDEGVFEFDTTQMDANFSPYTAQQVSPLTGQLYGMIYCDMQGEYPVYFLGRMFRVEPGSSV